MDKRKKILTITPDETPLETFLDNSAFRLPNPNQNPAPNFLLSTVKKEENNRNLFNFEESPNIDQFQDVPYCTAINLNSPVPVVRPSPTKRFDINLLEANNESGFSKIIKNENKVPVVDKKDQEPTDLLIVGSVPSLQKVIQLLSDLFLAQKADCESFCLEEFEFIILKYVMAKKLSVDSMKSFEVRFKPNNDQKFYEAIKTALQSFIGKKRKEEKLKFIYNHTIKYLKKVFLSSTNARNLYSNEDKELGFLNSYFGDLAKTKGIRLECFFDPLRNGVVKNPNYKSLTKDYFQLIFGCRRFKEDFLRHVEKTFSNDYKKKIANKFQLLFKDLKNGMKERSGESSQMVVEEFCKKLFKNKRCKLPWTINEIEEAKRLFNDNYANDDD